MAKPKRLCTQCRIVRDEGTQPAHLVNPVSGKPNLFDVHGNAVCPTCGAVWHRRLNKVELVG